jgi:peptide deformylase
MVSRAPVGPFVHYPHPALATPAVPRAVDDAMREIGRRLLEGAVAAHAYGLAAAHIGEAAPVIVLSVTPEAAASYELFYNPVVLEQASDLEAGREASVSLPGVEVEIARPVWAEIGFDTEEGNPAQRRFEGFLARCALHEIEQMNGRFFLANLSRLKREMALKKAAKWHSG